MQFNPPFKGQRRKPSATSLDQTFLGEICRRAKASLSLWRKVCFESLNCCYACWKRHQKRKSNVFQIFKLPRRGNKNHSYWLNAYLKKLLPDDNWNDTNWVIDYWSVPRMLTTITSWITKGFFLALSLPWAAPCSDKRRGESYWTKYPPLTRQSCWTPIWCLMHPNAVISGSKIHTPNIVTFHVLTKVTLWPSSGVCLTSLAVQLAWMIYKKNIKCIRTYSDIFVCIFKYMSRYIYLYTIQMSAYIHQYCMKLFQHCTGSFRVVKCDRTCAACWKNTL